MPYLARLGVGALYASPVFKARPGSTHGYDILDYNALNPELGGDAAFHRLAGALRAAHLGLILDIVPNHLCVTHEGSVWWNDVLRHGQASRYARMFDIDWSPPDPALRNRVVLPILLTPAEEALRAGALAVTYRKGEFWIRNGTWHLPTDPATWTLALDALRKLGGAMAPATVQGLSALHGTLSTLPSRDDTHPDVISARHEVFESCRDMFMGLVNGDGEFAAMLSGDLPARAPSADRAALAARMLEAQVYRLMYWPDGLHALNYRRYSDVSDLAGVRQEHPDVFLASHQRVLELIGTGEVTGLRVDHPDGLLDPAGYLVRLQRGCALMQGTEVESGRGLTPPQGSTRRALYLVVEKILSGEEPLRRDWPVHGTTGYEVLHLVNGLFIHPEGERPLRTAYAAFTGDAADFHAVLLQSKREVIAALFQGEHRRLTGVAGHLLQPGRPATPDEQAQLHRALGEVIAAFPVYTHYLRRMGPPTEPEAAFVDYAVDRARDGNPDLPPAIFAQIRSLLVMQGADEMGDAAYAERQQFALRFRQLLSAVMGKGLEDTALYRYLPLLSLNEMGGDPAEWATPAATFHARMDSRRRHWPHGMSTTSTHDTKRSEDVRARLNVLSEIPQAWEAAVRRWWAWHQPLLRKMNGRAAPDANEAWLIYQTLLGIWPMDADGVTPRLVERLRNYLRKALREAKRNSRWIGADERYEDAVLDFAAAILDPKADGPFLADFSAFHETVAMAGAYNSLAQALLKFTVPGVPDLYQGCELWDFSLVDPDNRRPVDFDARAAFLDAVEVAAHGDRSAFVRDARDRWRDGRIKLYLTRQALHCRARNRDAMEHGGYTPLAAGGRLQDHVLAFERAHGQQHVIAATGRWFTGLGVPKRHPVADAWQDTTLRVPGQGPYTDAFTGTAHTARKSNDGWELPLAEVFGALPVALLEASR